MFESMATIAGKLRGRPRVLVIEDDPHVRFGIVAALRAAGHEVSDSGTCSDGVARFRELMPAVVITDMRLPDGSAMDLLPRLRAIDPSVPVYVVTGYGSIDVAVAAVKQGAEDFLTKPVDMGRLLSLVSDAADRRATSRSGQRRKFEPSFEWTSDAMRRLTDQVERLREADCSVLILGETGTGKTVPQWWLIASGTASRTGCWCCSR